MEESGSKAFETEAKFKEIVANERDNPPLDAFFQGDHKKPHVVSNGDLTLSIDTIAALNSSIDFGAGYAEKSDADIIEETFEPPSKVPFEGGKPSYAGADEEVEQAEAFFLDPTRYAVLVY